MTMTRSSEEIEAWLTSYLANLLELPLADIDPKVNFDEYGLDSALAVSMTGDLEDWLGVKINPTLLYNYTNISDLSKGLAADNVDSKIVP